MSLPTDPSSSLPSTETMPPGEELGPIPYFPPPRKPGRTVAAVLAAVVIIAAGALSVGWWLIANRIEAGIDNFAARLTSQGGKLEADARTRSGFPFHPTVGLAKPTIAFPPGAPGPWSWSGEKANVSVSLFSPSTLDIDFSGNGQLTVAPMGETLNLLVNATTGTVRLSGNAVNQKASLKIADLSLASTDGEVVDLGNIDLDLTQANTLPSDEHEPAYDAILKLSNLTLPEDHSTPLGRTLAQLTVEAHVLGPLKQTFDEDAFKQWRDAGGTLQITQSLARFGPLAISIDGTFALDNGMQPLGAGTGRIQGYAPALDALAASQIIKLNDANAAKAFLSLMARPPSPGAPPQLTAPLTIQEGKLFVGPVAVMTMPHLEWPSEKNAAPVLEPREEPQPIPSAPDDDDTVTPAPYPRVEMPEGR